MADLPASAAAERNKQPILDVLRRVLGARGAALEIASGTGQHAAWFATALGQWDWQPSDADAGLLPVIAERVARSGLPNLRPPLLLDVMSAPWRSAAPSNLAFDRSLRARDPDWGIRRLEDVVAEAQRAGLALQERHAMPANNLLLVFRMPIGGWP
jgi:hypothetical protein